ncbi:hypothetical protein N9850_12465, partial [Granulosicoccus sp.]
MIFNLRGFKLLRALRRQKLAIVLAVLTSLPCRLSLASEDTVELDIWVRQAPLAMVIQQIATVAGKSVHIKGAIEGKVSGRLKGNLSETLANISDSHDVLFDLQEDSLHVISKRALSNVSIALPGAGLNESIQQVLDEVPIPGNTVALQDGTVKVSGHPNFVKRIVRKIGSGQSVYSVKKLVTPAPVILLNENLDATPELSAANQVKQKPTIALPLIDSELPSEPKVDTADVDVPISVKQVVSRTQADDKTIESGITIQSSSDESVNSNGALKISTV